MEVWKSFTLDQYVTLYNLLCLCVYLCLCVCSFTLLHVDGMMGNAFIVKQLFLRVPQISTPLEAREMTRFYVNLQLGMKNTILN